MSSCRYFKKLTFVYLLIALSLCMFLLVFASHIPQNDPAIAWNQNQDGAFKYSEPEARIASVDYRYIDFQQIQQYNRESELTEDQLSYIDKLGEPNINKIRDWKKLNKNTRNKALSKLTGREITTDEPLNGKVVGKGVQFDSIKFFKVDKTSLTNGVGVTYDGANLKFKSADSVLTDKSATTNIKEYNGYGETFSVDSADSFLSDCIRVDSIKDSEFKISDKVEITTSSDSNLKITDCSYNEFEFKGKGTISVDKSSDAPKYVVENGTLTKKDKGFNESIESNNSITVETDKTFGIKCLTITPAGSYFYNDIDLRKDFTINIPKESAVYKLCIRRDSTQQFKDYNGLIDFPNKKIELNGIVNYLRYPLKNNQISSLLGKFVYKGLKDVNTMLSYDSDLIFLNNIFLVNKDNVKTNILSITYPSNYYQITEMQFDDGLHSIIQLDLNLRKSDLTQNINYNYQTDYFQPKASIKDNVLIQNTPTQKITILPPEHEKIKEILENAKR